MKTHFNDVEYAKKMAQKGLTSFPPAIPFEKATETKTSTKDVEKDKYKTFDVKIDKEDENSDTIEYSIKVFEEGGPETYVQWYENYKELETMMPLEKPDHKVNVIRNILKGTYLEMFNTALGEGVLTDKKVNDSLSKVSLKAFNNDRHAYRRQVQYMRYQLYFTTNNFKQFEHRLKQLNKYLKYFPVPPGKRSVQSLPEDNLIEIIDNAKPLEYHQQMLQNNYDPYGKSLEEFVQYIERLEVSAKIGSALSKGKTSNSSTKKGKKRGSSDKEEPEEKKLHRCKYCKKLVTHKVDDCWEKPGNEDKKPGWLKKKKTSSTNKKTPSFTSEQVNFLIQNAHLAKNKDNKSRKVKKRKVTYKAQSESESDHHEENNAIDKLLEEIEENSLTSTNSSDVETYFNSNIVNHRLNKRLKTVHATSEVVGEIATATKNSTRPLRILLDSGTSATIILKEFVSEMSKFKHERTTWKTMGGNFQTRRKARISFKMIEFSHNKVVNWTAHVDDQTKPELAKYDMIIGSDLLSELKIDLLYSQQQIVWDEIAIPMKNRGSISSEELLQDLYELTKESTIIQMSETRHNEIIQAMYGKVDISQHVQTLKHLDQRQQEKLTSVLKAYPEMYEGAIGTLNIPPVHFELKKDAKPYHARPFPVPKAYESLTKQECRRFQEAKIWHHTLDSIWAAPSFIVPKKTGDVRVVTDFRELNKWIIRKPYPLPKILDILQKMERFKYATAIDLRKGYYHIPLDKQTQKLCTTVLPWGKYSYERLPMGIATSPDIFQKAMNDIFGDLDYVLVYLDDILILSNDKDTFDDHLNKVKTVFARLYKTGMKVNLTKTEFFKQELEYLGYLLTPLGIKPLPKKVEAITRILPPKTKRQLRRFLGMVNYYRDMWKRRSHILAPLSRLISQTIKWKWGEEEQKAFEEAKRMITKETMLSYPKFGEPFHIYADASDTQLGGVIMQDNKPLAFYTRKMNQAQRNYTTGEQELLSIVETLKSFENILMGQKLIVHTDHLNLLYRKLASARLIRWRMLLEEYGPEFKHVQGTTNVVADALSRLEMMPKQHDTLLEQPEQIQLSYLNEEDILEETFPMSPKEISSHQRKNKDLIKSIQDKEHYHMLKVEGKELIHYKGKIVIPETLKQRVMYWYHTYLVHPGSTRMLKTIQGTMYWPNMRSDIEEYIKTCHVCQITKKQRKKYGHLPAKKAEVIPWNRVNVDLIGPYNIKTKKKTFQLRAMTMIDPATSWFEIARIYSKSSEEAQRIFDSTWLARYPRPKEIGFDNGGEFKQLFSELCQNMGIKEKPTTDYNPQANAILERIHQVLGNQLRSFELEDRALTKEESTFEPFLTACAYAIRCTYHTTLQATPGQLVFGRDMILPITFKADWALIAQRKQEQINASNHFENKKRIKHDYKVGDKVLLTKPGLLRKLSTPRTGPYLVHQVFTNGTINIQKGAVIQRVNIRRVSPYHE